MRIGETPGKSKDNIWTINVVPTFAPSMTAKAGTGSTSPPAAKPVTSAALQDRRDADARQKSFEPIAQGPAEKHAHFGAKRTLHAGLHHVHTPQEQRHGSREVQPNENDAHCTLPPGRGSGKLGSRERPALAEGWLGGVTFCVIG
jgi:hypothetical protein